MISHLDDESDHQRARTDQPQAVPGTLLNAADFEASIRVALDAMGAAQRAELLYTLDLTMVSEEAAPADARPKRGELRG